MNITNDGEKSDNGSNEIQKEEIAQEEFDMSEYENLISQYQAEYKPPEVGEFIKGILVDIDDKYGIIDIGLKSEGIVPLSELKSAKGELEVSIGDELTLVVEQASSIDGCAILSKRKADEIISWEKIKEAYEQQKILTGEVIQIVKGGVIVNSGYKVFIPMSLFDVSKVKNIENYIGQTINFKLVNIDQDKRMAVGSRKVILLEQKEKEKQRLLNKLKEGIIFKGTVKNITEFGAFVDLGGADGLIHRSDIEWGKDIEPSEYFTIGQVVKTKVIKYDKDTGRISLGIKQLKPDPWLKIVKKYSVGSTIKGKVSSITDYGAFVEIKDGLHGLIHISELSWDKKIKHPSQVLQIGDEIKAYILKIDEEQKRISLSLREVQPNPWDLFKKRHPIGSKVTATVKKFSSMGAFVEVSEGLEGFIHIKDMTWAKKAKPPSEILKKGETITAEVLEIAPERERLRLGLKQLLPNAWEKFFKKYKEGDIVQGKITYFTDYGCFVEIEEGVEGLLHISEISYKRIQKPEDALSIGQEITAKIVKLDSEQKKISLSMKVLALRPQKTTTIAKPKQEIPYSPSTSSSKVTIGDIASSELQKLKSSQKKKK